MFDKEYVFYGKHAVMVKKLTGKLSDKIGTSLFNTNYDVYRLAPVIGWIYNRKGIMEKTGEVTKIFAEKIIYEKDELVFNYRTLIPLIYANKTLKERLDITFRLDEKDEERKEYDKVYNEYVLGGVEELYERIFNNASSAEEYLMNFYDFIIELNVRLYGETDIYEE